MNSERIKYMYQYLLNIANQCNNMIGTTVVLHNDIVAIKNELIALLRMLNNLKEYNSFWDMIHPSIIRVSKGLFDDGYYANALSHWVISIQRQDSTYKKAMGDCFRVPCQLLEILKRMKTLY